MNITVYTTSQCAICHALMEWLDTKQQPYTRVVVDEDEAGMAHLLEKSGGAVGVPFTVIEKDGVEEKIFGFDRSKFQSVLAV